MRRTITGALMLTVALGSALLIAAPAQAADRNCYDGEFCVYKDRDFSQNNSMYRFTKTDSDWNYGEGEIYEADSSWKNLSSGAARVYDGRWHNWGQNFCLNSYWEWSYSSSNNDDGASHKQEGGTC